MGSSTPQRARPQVVVLDDYERAAEGFGPWERLEGRADVRFLHERRSPAELAHDLAGADVVVAMRERTRFDADLLRSIAHVGLLVTTGHRNPAIDLAAAGEHGILVCDTRSARDTTAELTWGLVLACARRIVDNDRTLRSGRWAAQVGTSLEGRTLGLFGLGRIGRKVATYGKAFGMRTVAWSPTLTPERAAVVGARCVPREDLLRSADVLCVHARLTPRSEGVIGAREYALMRDGVIVVNTARAGLMVEEDTRKAVDAGPVERLGLDVFWQEPARGDEWYVGHPKVVATPHTGHVVDRAFEVFWNDAVEDIEAFLDGTPVRILR